MEFRQRISELARRYAKDHAKTLVKFVIVGLSASFIALGLLYFFTEKLKIYYLFAGVISNQIAVIWNFIWHDNWTWGKIKKKKGLTGRFVTFETIYISSMAANALLLYLFTDIFKIYYIYSMIFAIGILALYNYAMNSHLTFNKVE